MRKTIVYPLALCLLGASALAGCSWFGGDEEDPGGLRKALGRVAVTAETRINITYGDTSALVRLAGKNWEESKGFAPLRAVGLEPLAPYGEQVAKDTAIRPFDASYAIIAGAGTKAVGVISGGQRGEQVTEAMTKLGWREESSRLLAPDIGVVGGTTAGQYALAFAQMKLDGADLIFGEREADLSGVGKPPGKKLSEDKQIDALVNCLGDVVVAEFDGTGADSVTLPSMIAVGVRRPENATDTPRAVACFSWNSESGADKFATKVSSELNTAKARTGEKYSDLLKNSKVTKVGGARNVVRWQADTPTDALLALQLLARSDLPGLS